MTLTETLTLIAILAGPAVGAGLTRWLDARRELRQRRFDIFRTLMRTRKIPIHIDHVSALNLIEVEFINDKEIISAWKSYLANLGEPFPPVEEKERFDAAQKKRDSLLTKLLSELARSLNVKIEHLSILEGNYIPQGWLDEDWEHRLVRRSLIDVLTGRRAITMRPELPAQNSPYPPPPTAEQKKLSS
jgi:hypothetical protein